MELEPMSTTVMLTGLLPAVVLIASILAAPVSLLLLTLYRRAVQKGMSGLSGAAPAAPQEGVQHRAPSAPLRLATFDQSYRETPTDAPAAAYRTAIRAPWKTAAIYAIGGTCYAVIMTSGWLAATRDEDIVWTKVLLLFWTYFWPVALAAVMIAAYDRVRRLQVFAAYFLALLIIIAIANARNPDLGMLSLPLYWIIQNGPPTALVLVFLLRPIRAVGPLVVSFLIAVAIGSQSLIMAASANDRLLRGISDLGVKLGLNSTAVFIGMIAVGMLAFTLLGWPLLRLIGKRYEARKLSDQSITLDASWLLFAVVQSIGLAFEAPPWILTGLLAFIGYKLVCGLGFRLSRAATKPVGESKTLLLLRVFALGKRSEKLFDKLRKHWQYAGGINMIAGPDLVTTTIEPHEFLDFVSGRLGRQFVTDAEDLERRLAKIEQKPDPDGRYRIYEFFCRGNTWQMTMQRLAADCDAVLMDLRGFSAANQGCVFELGRLLDGVDLNRVLFLIDETTEQEFLETTLKGLWQNLSADSPNQTAASPTARLFTISRQSERELGALLRHLTIGAKSITA